MGGGHTRTGRRDPPVTHVQTDGWFVPHLLLRYPGSTERPNPFTPDASDPDPTEKSLIEGARGFFNRKIKYRLFPAAEK